MTNFETEEMVNALENKMDSIYGNLTVFDKAAFIASVKRTNEFKNLVNAIGTDETRKYANEILSCGSVYGFDK